MSEASGIDIFSGFDMALEDSALKPVFDQLQAAQELIFHDGIDEDAKRELLKELDSQWPYIGKDLTITGYVIMPGKIDLDDPSAAEPRRVYLQDAQVTSLGFTTTRAQQKEDPTKYKYLIGHYFRFEPVRVGESDLVKFWGVSEGFAVPNEVFIKYPFGSDQSYFDKMQYSFPDECAGIMQAKIDSLSESDFVMSLRNVQVPVRTINTEEMDIVRDYVNSLVTFDTKVPYDMRFQGDCYKSDDDALNGLEPAIAKPGSALGYPVSVEVLHGFSDVDGSNELTFGLRIVVIGSRVELDDGDEYIIPINDNFSMHSLRSLLYIALKQGDSTEQVDYSN